jgi:formylglycine-generating enzyme required for sulfatase activity
VFIHGERKGGASAEWMASDGRESTEAPAEGFKHRTLRGGSWLISSGSARAAYRSHGPPDYTAEDAGCRLVRTAERLSGQ